MKFAAAVCLVSATSALASVMRAEPIYARDVSGSTSFTPLAMLNHPVMPLTFCL